MNRILLAALALGSLLFLFTVPAEALDLVFDSRSATATGATPEGTVAWFSVARVPKGTHTRVSVVRELTTADLTGYAELSLPEGIEPRSIWGVVDLATGELALASPNPEVFREVPFSTGAFPSTETGEVTELRQARHWQEALLVRPATATVPGAAWAGGVRDGGESDVDGVANGLSRMAVSGLAALTEGLEAPTAFAPGDVLIAIDPDRLEASAVTFAEDTRGEGGER